jgi:hypothetical protein
MIIDDHKKSSAEMKTILASVQGAPALPTELDERRKGMLDNLRGASPADFDDVYLDQQTGRPPRSGAPAPELRRERRQPAAEAVRGKDRRHRQGSTPRW